MTTFNRYRDDNNRQDVYELRLDDYDRHKIWKWQQESKANRDPFKVNISNVSIFSENELDLLKYAEGDSPLSYKLLALSVVLNKLENDNYDISDLGISELPEF